MFHRLIVRMGWGGCWGVDSISGRGGGSIVIIDWSGLTRGC